MGLGRGPVPVITSLGVPDVFIGTDFGESYVEGTSKLEYSETGVGDWVDYSEYLSGWTDTQIYITPMNACALAAYWRVTNDNGQTSQPYDIMPDCIA